ncbi:MAG: acyl-CoA dehydrogenase family protein [Deltaproteobacteria bacterium]|uniref:Acyl-CoA dehydrogenase family protein n=1 Tax=Candidatus Zymogenus saltonus TaxID=2844893 RepID=A0A9D8PNS9_9DELT|nr:acyl-CoA dehydrogenase family protein [Candidatus Zymogenus saltonus]
MYRDAILKELYREEDVILIEMARDFTDDVIMPARQKIDEDKDHVIVHEILEGLANLGFMRAIWPEEIGGSGMSSALTFTAALEEIARGDAGIAVSLGVTLGWLFLPATLERNEAIINDFGKRCCEDELVLGCFSMTEAGGPRGGGGCDIENVSFRGKKIGTRAALDGDYWVLSGEKMWASNSGIAGLYLVTANTDPSLGDEGIALIYVPADAEGLSFGKFENKAGLQADRNCPMFLDGVVVPKEYRLAGPGRDAECLHQNLTIGRIGSAAMSIGCAQGAFEAVLEFTKDRVVGLSGKPIRQHSIAASMIADMAIGIETARNAYVAAAYKYDHPEEYGPSHSTAQLSRASLAKVYAAEVAISVTNKAMELMGSYGYVREYNVEKYWRDCKIIQLWEGGAQLGRFDVCRGYYDLDL